MPARQAHVDLLERLEDRRPLVRRNARTGVGHRDRQVVRAAALGRRRVADLDPNAALGGELDRVGDDVEQHLPQALGVGAQGRRNARRDPVAQVEALFMGAAGEQLDHAAGQRARIRRRVDRSAGVGAAAAELQKIVDQQHQRFRRGGDRLDIVALFRRQGRVGQELAHADNAVEGRSDLVADDRKELRFGRLVFTHSEPPPPSGTQLECRKDRRAWLASGCGGGRVRAGDDSASIARQAMHGIAESLPRTPIRGRDRQALPL